MKIICISDTHIGRGKHLPPALLEALENVDLILHAGDITSMEVIDELKAYGHVEAVAGNMDGWYVSRHLPEKRLIEAGKFLIGLTHGGGNKLNLEERVVQKFLNDKVDCIVYGHSHRANIEKRGGILLVNPGSPTDQAYAPFNSYAVITADEELKAEIIKI